MIIKRIGFDTPIRFQDINGVYRNWPGIPLANRFNFIQCKQKALNALLHDEDWQPESIQALELAGFQQDWIINERESLIGPLLVGSVDSEGKIPGVIESNEFPYLFEQGNSLQPVERTEILERTDRLWLTQMNGDRLIINPLPGSLRRELDGYRGVLTEYDGDRHVRETYDSDKDFRYCCQEILKLYGIDLHQVNTSQMIQLIFQPGYLNLLEIPLMQHIGGKPLPAEEDPYDSVLASIWLSCPSISLNEHAKILDSIPWVRLQSILNSANSLNEKSKDTETSMTGGSDGASKPKSKSGGQWKKTEFDSTKKLLDKLKSGEAKVKPMSKAQRRALGG